MEYGIEAFEKELTHLINRHSIENAVDMPDFLLAGLICRMIETMGPSIKRTLDWHGCNSVCHPLIMGKEGHAGSDGEGKRGKGHITNGEKIEFHLDILSERAAIHASWLRTHGKKIEALEKAVAEMKGIKK